MKVATLEKLLKPYGTKIIKVGLKQGQDPFVLYPKNYYLNTYVFNNEQEIIQVLSGKNVIATDCQDPKEDQTIIKLMYHISDTTADVKRAARLR